jgi:hypothetical protein
MNIQLKEWYKMKLIDIYSIYKMSYEKNFGEYLNQTTKPNTQIIKNDIIKDSPLVPIIKPCVPTKNLNSTNLNNKENIIKNNERPGNNPQLINVSTAKMVEEFMNDIPASVLKNNLIERRLLVKVLRVTNLSSIYYSYLIPF